MSAKTKEKKNIYSEFSSLKMKYQNSCRSKIATTEKDCLWEDAPPKYLFPSALVMTVRFMTAKDSIKMY